MSKYLFVLLGLGGTAGAATAAFALTNQKGSDTNNQKNTDLGPKQDKDNQKWNELEQKQLETNPQLEQTESKDKITKPHIPQIKDEEKVEFQGKLVFTRDLNPLERRTISTLIYIGEVFNNNEYKEQEEKWKNQDREDGDDPSENEDKEAHITIDLSPKKLKKDKKDFEDYLNVFNEKIKKSSENGHLKKLEKSLEDDSIGFKENFGDQTYNELIKKIKDLKGNTN